MTISSQRTVHKYVGDGTQGNWPVLFTFLEPEHVQAIKTSVAGVDAQLVYGTDYLVEMLEGGGGSCVAPLAQDEKMTLFLDVPLTQDTDLRNAGKLSAEVIERMSDKLTLALQQQREDLERCVQVPATSSTTPEQLMQDLTQSVEDALNNKHDVEALKSETEQFVGTAKSELNVIKSQTQQLKNDSAAQVGLAAAEVVKARGVVSTAETLVEDAQTVIDGAQGLVTTAINDGMQPVVAKATQDLTVIKEDTRKFKNDSVAQVALAAAEVVKAQGVVATAETLVQDAQTVIDGAQGLVTTAINDGMQPVVAKATQDLTVIKEDTRKLKNDSAAQVGLAAAEVVKAQGVVSTAETLVQDAQTVIDGAQGLVTTAISEGMQPVVAKATQDLTVIKEDTRQYKNDSVAQVALAAAEVVKAQGVVSDAATLVSNAQNLINSAQSLIDQAINNPADPVDELLSGMVVPFKGTVNGAGHPVNRMTGTADAKYAVCDGRTYTAPDGFRVVTPDLRDRFIAGAGGSYSQGAKGGANTVTLTVDQMPEHSHSIRAFKDDGTSTFNDLMVANRTTTAERTVSATGGSKAHENRPPFYALAYLMKL